MSNIKKKNAVMLADTRPALVGTVLLQLQRTNPGLFDEAIIYYVDEIAASDREVMCSIMPCRFVKYLPPLRSWLFKKPRFSRFSALMFCRYEMFAYLAEFETITWLDTDILIQGDLRRLIELAKTSGAALIREDPLNKTAENPDRMRTCFTGDLPGYRLEEYLYCSGTIVFTDKIAVDKDYTRWCYEKTVEWADILSLPDQGVINAAIQAFNIKVTAVSGKDYCCYPSLGRDCSGAAIVHAWGSNKFWNDWYLYLHYPVWGSYYEEWQGMGGSSLGYEIAPLISVVIPAYKPDLQLFKQCLDSLMQQNRDNWERFSDFEIIIVAEPFEQAELQRFIDGYQDKRIRLEFNEERLGIAASLNRGLRLARGKYVARVDDDDICASPRLYLQGEYLAEHPEIALCTSDFEYFGDMNERRVSFEGEMSRAWSALTCPFDHPTIMFRRDFFVDNDLFYDEKRGYVEDWELWLRAFAKGLTVGCIHRVLYYHRWLNNGSAGQTSKTVDMMRELVHQNFLRLGVEIGPEDLPVVGPWNGRVVDGEQLERLAGYFAEALEHNERLHLYDQKSLAAVFELRLTEARTGVLPGLSESTQQTKAGDSYAAYVKQRRPNILKRMVKAVFKPFYRPFRHRYEERLIEMQSSNWRNEGHLLNCIEKLDRIVSGQQEQIEALRQHLDKTQLELEALLLNQSLDMRQELSGKMFAEAENTRQELSGKMFTEAENTRQELSAKMFTEAENTRQELSGKMFTEAENTRQELSAKMFTEAENTRGFVERKVWQAVERVNTVGDHVYDVSQELRFQHNLMLSEQPGRAKLFLLGTSEHSNIGDAAITLGERAFLHKYFPEHSIVELSTYDFDSWYGKIANMIEANDLIFLQGGGNLGNRFLPEEKVRRRVIGDFPNNRIVIMPQTIYFDDNEAGQRELALSREVYNRHEHLTIFTRGLQSKLFAEKNFGNAKVINSLDMALMLDYNFNMSRKGALLCLRDLDDESGLDAASYGEVVNTVENCFAEYVRTNNLYNGDVEANILRDMRREVVTAELAKFAGTQVVVTDRLHGLIFAVITHTPCVVISAFNQKIAEFCEFFADSNGVFFIDKNIDMLSESIEKALQVGDVDYPILRSGFFDKVYDAIQKT